MNEYERQLGEGRIFRLLMKFAIPAILSNFVTLVMNIINSIYLGNHPDVGKAGLAALSVCFPLQMILATFGILFGIGGSILFSLSLGQGDKERAGQVLGTSLVGLATVGVLAAVIVNLFARPILTAFGASPEILPYAEQYARIYMTCGFATALSAGGNIFMRADGSPARSMAYSIGGAACNALFGYLLIDVLNMGMAGAAWATIIGQLFIAVLSLVYFFGQANVRLTVANLRPQFGLFPRIASIGLAQSLLALSSSILFAILNRSFFAYGGDVAVSGMGVINPLQQLALTPVQGLVMGTAPILGFNFGAQKYSRTLQLLKTEILAAFVFGLLGWLILLIFPTPIIALFNDSPDLISYGAMALPIWFACFPLAGLQIVGANFFQASGQSTKAVLLTLTRQVIFLIPLALIFPLRWGLEGILAAAPAADAASAAVVGVMIALEWRKIRNMSNSIQIPTSI